MRIGHERRYRRFVDNEPYLSFLSIKLCSPLKVLGGVSNQWHFLMFRKPCCDVIHLVVGLSYVRHHLFRLKGFRFKTIVSKKHSATCSRKIGLILIVIFFVTLAISAHKPIATNFENFVSQTRIVRTSA